MSKRTKDTDVGERYDKDEIRNKRTRDSEFKRKKIQGKKKGADFNRHRARQEDSERSRIEEYFYN